MQEHFNRIDADRLVIVALDVPNAAAAEKLIERIDGATKFFKIGLELFAAGEGIVLLKRLSKQGLYVFADFKFFDIPATVGRAVAQIADSGAAYVSVHGQDQMLKHAAAAAGQTGVLAITALTSFDASDMKALGFGCSAEQLAVSRAERAVSLGCAGVVCSPLETAKVRQAAGSDAVIVTPGIRPAGSESDDQSRIATIEAAVLAGASHVVVGRQVRDADDPAAEVLSLIEQAQAARAAIEQD